MCNNNSLNKTGFLNILETFFHFVLSFPKFRIRDENKEYKEMIENTGASVRIFA